MSIKTLRVDEFVRSVRVNRNSPHAMFLGAGASLSSGVPSANRCISEWKRDIFVTNNPTLRDFVAEITLPSVEQRVDNWLRQNGYWPGEGADDYSYFIERCLPIADDRRKFFEPWIRQARPYSGYQLLSLLAEAQIVRSVWTTNFDGLVVRACATTDVSPIEVGIDCQHRVWRQPSRTELLCVSLHGDYRYDPLSNTAAELQEQEAQLRVSLIGTLKDHSLIVCGYSGRDKSIMAALKEAVTTVPALTKIYWCGYATEPVEAVSEVLSAAHEVGREAFYVPGADFDDVMSRLATACIDEKTGGRVREIIGSADDKDLPIRKPFETLEGVPSALIKSNAFPLRCPSEVFAFDLTEWPSEHVWKWLAEKAKPHSVIAVPFKKVLAFGTIDGIKSAFDGCIHGGVQRVPLSDSDFHFEDGAVMSLLRQALVQAIASTLDLATDGKSLIWERESFKSESHSGNRYAIHRCVGIAIRPVDGRLYLTINPTFHVPDGLGNGKTDVQAVQKRLLGYQHNSEYNQDLNYWRQKLGQNESEVAYDYPPGTAAFEFTLNTKPAYATISSSGKGISIPTSVERLIRHRGVSVVEPKLLFAPTAGWQPSSDTMPLRGLANNGPYDLALSTSPLGERLRLSVVCPKAESGLLENFLNGINGQWHPKGNTGEYLVPYPGFANALRIPIDIPKRSDVRWFTLPEIAPSCDDRTGALSLSRNICDAIQAASASSRSIVVILTPERWERWRHFESDDETFDVHNFVKAFAVQRGISTQFLTQEKLSVEDKCRFWWWFAVALYAKAMRTPWVLEGLDSNTAFVGLGYAIDSMARSGGKIVLGCSHLYNALGQGLQFRLSRIENPIIRGRNPYLSFDDARRMGETIRALYWEAHQRLPDRVVIHKLFPFRAEESKGLLRGLEGVDILDLVEINHESKLRYLSSRPTKGGFQDDRFPVRRGTLVRLSDFEALGWVHGATDAIRTNWTYFQGKRRIPGPVIIRRHAGSSTLSTLFNEILGLSKMDWNSGDLYSQLPATVQSSKAIAQIGSLLERFGKESYDYRLFM